MPKAECMWVVHKVNPHKLVHTPGDAVYHDTPMLDDEVGEVYQVEELPPSFVFDPGVGLDDLVRGVDDIEMHVVVK
jgi:hypothetical protein